jgi:ABC-2 type transport system permease protein
MNREGTLQKLNTAGWLHGFRNLFNKEIREWLEVRRWFLQIILWMLILNGFLAAVLFILPNLVVEDGAAPIENPAVEGMIGFFGLGGLALSVGIIILTQNEIIGERQSGTAEWVLSKPVARSAFYLSKFSANLIGMLGVLILVPSAVGYTLVGISHPGSISPLNFLVGVGMMSLHVFFYLSLSLMMGVLANSREVVLGVSLGILLLGMIARNFVGPIAIWTPWLLSDFAGLAAIGEPIGREIWLAMISTGIWSLIFNFIALWRFNKMEF